MGEPLRVAARVRGRLPAEVILRGMWKGEKKEWKVAVGTARVHGDMLAAQWARARLAAMELAMQGTADAEDLRKQVVAISKKYHVLSKETTLIAIEHRSLEERTKGMPAVRGVPVMLAEGWGGVAGGSIDRAMICSLASIAPAPTPAQAAPGGIFRRKMRGGHGPDAPPASASLYDSAIDEAVGTDPLHALLLGQTAEGWFAWDELLTQDPLDQKAWNLSEARREVEGMILGLTVDLRLKVLATALTVRAFRDRADQWRLAVAKAMRWLGKVAPEVKAWAEKTGVVKP